MATTRSRDLRTPRSSRVPRTFTLTSQLVAANAGSSVVCLAPLALGQTYRLHARRPGPEMNRRLSRFGDGSIRALPLGDLAVGSDGESLDVATEADEGPALTRVDVSGVLEQRAGYHDICAGYSDGHDAVAERMIAALADGDVLVVFDSPGGAHAGLQAAVDRVVKFRDGLAASGEERHVTGFVDELCGSAAYWWAACVCDEIYAPESAIIGSIGARSATASIAGALAKDGVEVTYFAWPGAGKIAFAPELPTSDIARERGDRDTSAAGESFAAAVGPRRDLSRKEIVELDADALSGQTAIDAKLIDGVASFEDVLEYCVTLAGARDAETSEEKTDMDQINEKNLSAKRVALATPAVRTEGDEDPEKKNEEPAGEPDGDEKKDEEPQGKEPSAVCSNCGMQNEDDAKYCDQCGESMQAAPMADDAPDGDGDDDSVPPPAPGKKPSAEAQVASTIAGTVGLRRNASPLAVKTAVLEIKSTLDRCMAITGSKSPSELEGAVAAHVQDAQRLAKLEASHREILKTNAHRERTELLTKLAAANLPGFKRGDLFVDKVDDSGKRSTSPAPMYQEMKLATLRGFVTAKIGNTSKTARVVATPFEPSREAAKAATDGAKVEIEKAKPEVSSIKERFGSIATVDSIAASHAALVEAGIIPAS